MKAKLFFIAGLLLLCGMQVRATVHTISVADYSFSPSSLTANLGDTIKWVWISGSHTTTSTTIPSGASSWDAGITSSSTTYQYVPSVTGTYNYECTPHASMNMIGSFTVVCGTVPTPNVSPSGTASGCQGSPLSLSTTAIGSAYQWKLNNDDIMGAISSTYGATSSGSYTVTVTTACGSATSAAVVVTINPKPVLNISQLHALLCPGTCDTILVGGANNYVFINVLNSAGNVAVVCPSSTNIAKVVGTSAQGCRSDTASVTTTVLPVPVPAFTHTHSGLTYTFTNHTTNGGAQWLWDFGHAGATSTQQHPVHTFPAPGNYAVKLTATHASGCAASLTNNLNVVSVAEVSGPEFFAGPNPAHDRLLIRTELQDLSLSLQDISGRNLGALRLLSRSAGELQYDLSTVPAGLYLLRLSTPEGVWVRKIVIQ